MLSRHFYKLPVPYSCDTIKNIQPRLFLQENSTFPSSSSSANNLVRYSSFDEKNRAPSKGADGRENVVVIIHENNMSSGEDDDDEEEDAKNI